MSFMILLAALLLAHYRPLPPEFSLLRLHRPLALWLERTCNDGRRRHGLIAWGLGALIPAVLLGAGYLALKWTTLSLAAPVGMLLLYLMLDFRGFGVHAEGVAADLRNQNLEGARARIALATEKSVEHCGATELARLTIEGVLLRAHVDLFAPIFWFVLLGPAGALLYRFSQSLAMHWSDGTEFSGVAQRAYFWLDWLPARFTAIAFAVVGDFEDALYCWRTQASQWKDEAAGIMLASGAGALGVLLGGAVPLNGTVDMRPELGLGDAADADYLMSAIGLVWRALVLMMALMLLMAFSRVLGS